MYLSVIVFREMCSESVLKRLKKYQVSLTIAIQTLSNLSMDKIHTNCILK